MSTFKVQYNNGDECRFQHSNGGIYYGQLEGCGQAFHILDANKKEISVIPTEVIGEITEADIELACSVITSIALTKGIAEFRQKQTVVTVSVTVEERELVPA